MHIKISTTAKLFVLEEHRPLLEKVEKLSPPLSHLNIQLPTKKKK